MNWFEEEGIYVVEKERVLFQPGKGGSLAAEWEGVWRGVNDTVWWKNRSWWRRSLDTA